MYSTLTTVSTYILLGVELGTILGWARLAVLAGALALTNCVTTENTLSQDDIANMKLTGITVGFAPDAFVQWEDGFRAYATAKSIPDDQIAAATNTPECKEYVKNMLAPRLKAGIERSIAGQLNGSRPVRLEVTMRRLEMPSAVQRILVGGNRGMVADARLVDARTGAVIIAHPGLSTSMYTGQGVGGALIQAAVDQNSDRSPVDKVFDDFGNTYRDWLLRRT
jgi:hypothetical protein